MTRDLLLAIDNGTQSVRALLFDLRGNLIAKSRVPLVPYVVSAPGPNRFAWSTASSLAVLFTVGAARARVGTGTWWANGLEMVGLGVIVGAVAYYSGSVVASLIPSRRLRCAKYASLCARKPRGSVTSGCG